MWLVGGGPSRSWQTTRPAAALVAPPAGRLRARRSANVVTAGATRVDMYESGHPRIAVSSQIRPTSQIRLAKERERRARSWTFLLSLWLGGCCAGHRRLQRAGGRLEGQHRSHPVAGRWSHGCPAAASHWKDDFARVFGQRKSEVGQRRPPAARFGRSWSAGVFAGMHGQGAPSGMGFDRKVMALRLPGRPGRQRESWAWTRRRSSLGLNGFVT